MQSIRFLMARGRSSAWLARSSPNESFEVAIDLVKTKEMFFVPRYNKVEETLAQRIMKQVKFGTIIVEQIFVFLDAFKQDSCDLVVSIILANNAERSMAACSDEIKQSDLCAFFF